MPSHLSFISNSGGDDRHTVRKLPVDDNEFADLLHFAISDELQGQDELFHASTINTLPSNSSSVSVSHVTCQPMSSSIHNHKEPHGNDWASFEWIDYNASWNSMNDFQNNSLSLLADKTFAAKVDNPFNESNLFQAQSPILQVQVGRQEKLDRTDFICMAHEKPIASRSLCPVISNDDKTANTEAVSPRVQPPASPLFPTAPNSQLPVNTSAASFPIASIAARTIKQTSSSTQKRQRVHSIATSQLRPKFNHILPNTGKENVTLSPMSACNSSPRSDIKHTQDHTSGRRARRSNKCDEESLRKRRNYQRVAEQARRHRFNSALRDLEALLPSNIFQEKNEITPPALDPTVETKRKEKTTSTDQTKACVMELAIEYIKTLRTTLSEKDVRMRELGAPGSSILL